MNHPPREIDARAIPPAQRHSAIFGAFDGLVPNQALVLVNDHDPKPLLYQFQAERPNRFDWNVLESGPERFRIEIRCRKEEAPRNVSEYLETDHRRLDAIVPEVKRLIGEGAYTEAARRFSEFSCGLDRHIIGEEDVLFPAFERLTGMRGGPTTVMRAEHVEIRRFMAAATMALQEGNRAGATSAIESMLDVLGGHNMKEEQILYPTTDQAAGDDRARDDLVRRIQAV